MKTDQYTNMCQEREREREREGGLTGKGLE